MDAGSALATEYLLATGINVWGALKSGAMPWPPTIVGSSVAFGILLLLSAVSERLALMLSTGFLLALIIGNLQRAQGGKIADVFGALPPDEVTYDTLHFKGKVG